jgi:fibronectin-binding autotransporter adhesin
MKKTMRLLAGFASVGLCLAGDGVWTMDADGTWSDAANWANGDVANGVGSKAAFTTPFTADRTVTIDGAVLSPTLGEIAIGEINKKLTVRSSNGGLVTLDNGEEPAILSTAAANSGEITFSTPIAIAGNKRLDVHHNYNGDRYLKLAGKISGENVVIANHGTGDISVVSIEAQNSFTGELWAVSSRSRLNVACTGIEETAAGDPYNVIRVFPDARLTLARYAHAVVNPLRTIVMEGQGVSGIGVFHNSGEGNEKKHVPAPITGDGGLQTQAHVALSGKNTFTGTLKLNSGTLQVASLDNLGAGKLVVDGNGTTLAISGTSFDSFGEHLTEFNVGNNGGTYFSILDPNHVFTMDRELGMSLNSGNAPAVAKNGPGELRFVVPQTFRNATGRMLSLDGGAVTVDYAAGARLYGNTIADQNRLGFKGGVLKLRMTGVSTDIVQNLGDLWLYGDGGRLVIDNRNATGTADVRFGTFVLKASPDSGQTLSLEVLGDASKVVFRSTAANDGATGIWGEGRIVLKGGDWPCIEAATNRVIAYTTYTPLASAGSTDNALVNGTATVASDAAINTLKIAPTASGQSLTINSGTTLTLNNTALLFTGSEDYTLSGGQIGSGRLASDILLHQFGTGRLTVDTDFIGTNGITALTKTGPGKVVLARASKLGGQVTIADGVLEIGMASALMYTTNSTLTGVTSSTASPLVTCTASELPYGFLPGSSVLGKTVNLINGTSGNWLITLNGNANATLTDGSATYTTRPTVRNNGTLRVTDSMTIPNTFVYGGNGARFDIADGKTVSLTGGKSGGVFILDNTDSVGDGVVRVSGVVEMGSGVYIRRGVYEADGDHIGACGANPLVFGNGETATFRMRGGKTVLVAELSGTNANAVVETWTSGTTLFGVLNGGDNRFDGVIRDGVGAIRLAKGGGGTLTLNGANTYSGTTDVKGGVLAVNGSLAASSQVNVQGGALGGTGSVHGPVVVKGKGRLAPGAAGIGTLTTGDLTLEEGATLDFELGEPGSGDRVAVDGDLVLGGVLNVAGLSGFGAGTYTLMTCSGTLVDNGLSLGSVPDPRLAYHLRTAPGKVVLTVGMPSTTILIR